MTRVDDSFIEAARSMLIRHFPSGTLLRDKGPLQLRHNPLPCHHAVTLDLSLCWATPSYLHTRAHKGLQNICGKCVL